MRFIMFHSAVPAQCLGVKVPHGHGAIAGSGQQERGVGRQCADSHRTAVRVLQRCGRLTCRRAPDDGGAVCGAGEQVAAAGAEAAAVNRVAVTRQRRVRQLGEVSGVINANCLIAGTRR